MSVGADVEFVNGQSLVHALNRAHEVDGTLYASVDAAIDARPEGWHTYTMLSGAQGDWLHISLQSCE